MAVAIRKFQLAKLLKQNVFMNFLLPSSQSREHVKFYHVQTGLDYLKHPLKGPMSPSLQNDLKWSIGRCSVKSLAKLIEFLIIDLAQHEKNFSKARKLVAKMTFEENDVYPLAIESIHKRWVEVSTGTELISIFKIISIFEDEVSGKLENRAIELVHQLTSMEILKLFIVLGEQKRRPTPLLRSMAFHLSKSEMKIPTKEKIELIYALNELNFADPVLMTTLCDDLTTEIPSIENSALFTSLVTSLGQMRYKHNELCRRLEEWILKRMDSNILRSFDIASWLLTSAVLNIGSEGGAFEKAAAKTLISLPPKCPIEWVNLIHALAVLDQLSPELLSSLFDNNTVKYLVSQDGSPSAKIRLLQLNAFAKKLKGYKGPTLEKEQIKKITIHVKPNDEKLSRLLIETLSSFVPVKHIQTNVQTEEGIFIDALIRLNEKGEPSNGPNDEKVSLMIQSFQSTCLGTKEPTGQRIFQEKILRNEGYTPIIFPYTEFNSQTNLLNRVKYLEKKLKSGRRKNENSNHD